jgi:PadR family transcriptional regulator, regulatory protein PadR
MSQLQQVRKGSTSLLILSVLAGEKMYGYQIMRELETRSQGYFTMTAALLYPALHQLEQDNLVEGEWEDGPGKRRRKYYSITPKGRQAMIENQSAWQDFVTHLSKVLKAPESNIQVSQ